MATSSGPEFLHGKHKYQCVRRLNSGTFGFVKMAIDLDTGKQVAVKFMDRGEKISKYVEREIMNHRRLVHPHIVRFREILLTENYLCIVMEYAAGGDMFDYVLKRGGLAEKEARWFFQQLIVATDFMHRMGVANRDIKLENTLLDASPKPLIKLCDFGYSKHEKFQSAPGSRVGTPAYLAPEVILTTKGTTYDGKMADIWSCGVMLYVMLMGSYPFERIEDKNSPHRLQNMIQRILQVDYELPDSLKDSEDLRDLLSKMLVPSPEERIRIEDIYKHPWYNTDLPQGVKEMNDKMAVPLGGYQTEEEIRDLLSKAREVPRESGHSTGTQWSNSRIDAVLSSQQQ